MVEARSRSMDLRQLNYFLAVAEEGSFTRAARRCRIAQPSLSQQIRKLEEELGQPLFLRRPRKVELTEAGQAVCERARELVDKAREFREVFIRRQELEEGEVAVGVIPTIAPYLLPGVVAAFAENFPRIGIRIREAKTSELIGMIAEGSIDLAIASDVAAADRKRVALKVRELFRETLLLAVPKGHALASGGRPVPLSGLPTGQMIMLSEGHCLADQVLRLCRMNREASRIECGQLESLLALVGAGLGVGFVPEMSTRAPAPGVAYRRLGSPEPQRLISVIHKGGTPLSPAAAKFLEYVQPGRPD
jgi:LysR family transcriptional regulator, hydrogen peroxide-inducible genes activator